MRHIIPLCIAFLAASCAGNGGSNPQEQPQPQSQPQESATTTVQSAPAREEPKLLVSKGVIRSDKEVKVYSRLEGQLLEVKLIEGQKVRAGQVLFNLDDMEIREKITLKESEYQQAVLKMQEILVGQGYRHDALQEVPEETMEYARIKSGVNVKKAELDQSQAMLKRTVIKSELSGVITGIEALPYGFVKPGETLCTVVDPDHLIVVFSILETELGRFEVGKEIDVRAIAYADVPHAATVRSIGSVVDEGGMVKVEAVLSDTTNLIPGMTAIINL